VTASKAASRSSARFRRGAAASRTRNARLLAAMRRLGSVDPLVVGFSRMYPRFLYPGTLEYSDEEKKKNSLEGEEGRGAERLAGASRPRWPPPLSPLLDGLNPYSFRAGRPLSFIRRNLSLVLPWWTSYFAPHISLLLGTLRAESPSTVRLLLCHNVFSTHDGASLKDALTRAVLRRADRLRRPERGECA